MAMSGTWDRLFRFHGQRNTRSRKGFRGTSEPEDSRALADYMREVSTTPLLERENEELHTQQKLHESREAFAALVLKLPSTDRMHVLNGDPEGPALRARWPLRDLDTCFDRMTTHLKRLRRATGTTDPG